MNDGSESLDTHERRVQSAADTVRRTRGMISISKREIDDGKRLISFARDTITKTQKLLKDQQTQDFLDFSK